MHGVLSGPAIERLNNSKFNEFVCTNPIDQSAKEAQLPIMTVLHVGGMLGEVIRQMETNSPVSEAIAKFM